MKAILTIGHRTFAFPSAAKAAAVLEALSKSVAVRRLYEGGSGYKYEPEEESPELSVAIVEDSSFVLPGRVPRERRLEAPSKARP